jgi:hypothetical protein
MDIVEYYKSKVSRPAKAALREKIMKRCDMSYPLFMGRMQRNNWTKLEREAIECIINEEMEAMDEIHNSTEISH